MSGRMQWTKSVALACACACVLGAAGAASAGVKSLIAGLRNGDEMRYTFSLHAEESTMVKDKPGVGTQTVNTETVGVLIRVKAETTALDIVEVVYESFHITMDSPLGKLDLDLGGTPPDGTAAPLAHELYDKLHGLVGLVITLNIAPGSGEISTMHGGEELLKAPGAPVFRRYVDPDLFRTTWGDVFQLKSNSMMPPPGDPWYVKAPILAYGRAGKTSVWETRKVETVLADIATIKGEVRATGNPEDAGTAAVFFKSISSDCIYKWDTFRSRLLSATRNEAISTRSERGNIMYDSDLLAKSTLEFVPPGSVKPKTPAPKPTETPKPAAPPTPAQAPAPDGKPAP